MVYCEIEGFEKEILTKLPSHPESINEYCPFIANLYEDFRRITDYDIQRVIYWYLKNHEKVLDCLIQKVHDRISLWKMKPEDFINSKPAMPMPDNLIGSICNVFMKAFKIAVVKKDKEAINILREALKLYDEVITNGVKGIIYEEYEELSSDIKKQLSKMDWELELRLHPQVIDRSVDLAP